MSQGRSQYLRSFFIILLSLVVASNLTVFLKIKIINIDGDLWPWIAGIIAGCASVIFTQLLNSHLAVKLFDNLVNRLVTSKFYCWLTLTGRYQDKE